MTDLKLKTEILTHLDLADLALADQDKVLAQLEENILAQLHLAVIEELTEMERADLVDLDDDSAEKIFQAHLGPDLIKKVATEVVTDFKKRLG
ncbi:MAG: hypothetical protein COX02_00225 [Candidatus Vogelbacteria bacterium CG22_combo_CG10-13_8_21_14_all_37_9]|uniref:Uncharacterized protein n=1 Tax=Candidatus Vogelbacteria bacterium CG22_combo_CG10-13_8_21_14_all_37_9 TaxID=1975046 RepID=A0A2H0BL91_9BACT|nr:MAG: hypothetical protein COX02_00225 [Candidatus Vogelbacteria bacterium CG22_combo_CG10-13_8_21_14_all_37_9]